MAQYDTEIIVRVCTGTEGIHFDVWVDPDELSQAMNDCDEESDDGGICTNGWHTKECNQEDDCGNDACEKLQEKPYSPENFEAALGMAVDAAVGELKRREKAEEPAPLSVEEQLTAIVEEGFNVQVDLAQGRGEGADKYAAQPDDELVKNTVARIMAAIKK